MGVFVADSTNTSYDGNLDTASGFYRGEAYNVSVSSSTVLAVSTVRYIAVTFANAGNLKGIVLGCSARSVATTDRGMRVGFYQILGTVTMSIASPCIVTYNTHGFTGDEIIEFGTTGALPTGITAGTKYYVKYINANTFNIAATAGGDNINTSGTQSGTHTLYAERDYVAKTAAQINPEYILGSAIGTSGVNWLCTLVPFKFTGGYAVDVTASKWRFRIEDDTSAGSTTAWSLTTSDATNPSYVAWCDNKVSASDDDFFVAADKIVINKSFTTAALVGTGDTTKFGGWICRHTTITAAAIALLEWANPPAASYTLTLAGEIVMGAWAGFRVGTSTDRIANAVQAIITNSATSGIVGFIPLTGRTTSSRPKARTGLFLYGAIPTNPYGILSEDAAISQATFKTTDDLSAVWQAGDTVFIGKQDTKGQGTIVWQTIQSISGTTVTLTGNLLTNTRKAGGTVINRDRGWGIVIQSASPSATNMVKFSVTNASYFEVSGVKMADTYMNLAESPGELNYPALPANCAKWVLEDNLGYFTSTGITAIGLYASYVPTKGISCQRNIVWRTTLMQNTYFYYYKTITTIPFNSGTIEFKNNRILNAYSGGQFATTTYAGNYDIQNNVWENGGTAAYAVILTGKNTVFSGNIIYGMGTTLSSGSAVKFGTSVGTRMSANYFDNNVCGCAPEPSSFVIDAESKNDIFGSTQANTADTGNASAGYVDFSIVSPTGAITFDTNSSHTDMLVGSSINVVDDNNVTNVDYAKTPYGNFTRCGDGLTDTTVHTSGTGKFSIRFESTSSTNRLEFESSRPTGNIQNKDLMVGVWVKISSANYYGGTTHQLPRITIDYDNGTTSYSEAAESTDWQFIKVSVTPTTAYGQIIITLSTMTDATGSDAYVYFDDISVLDPAGVTVNTGGMDLWTKARPITPFISTSISAQDVWAADPDLFGAGTVGEKFVDLSKMSTGRWKVVNNQMIFYDEDGVTVLKTYNLYDVNGNATMINAYERDPA